jgi:dihydrofolate reductase
MKVILYMAMTVNGMIATTRDNTPWSKVEWKSFNRFIKKRKNIIIGRRTYELMKKSGDLSGLDKIYVIVVSSRDKKSSECIFVTTPRMALEVAKKIGFKEVVIAGGSKLNASFVKEGLIDDIYLDVEQMIFGKGVNLFGGEDFHVKLRLVGTRKLSPGIIQLHYKVLKKKV